MQTAHEYCVPSSYAALIQLLINHGTLDRRCDLMGEYSRGLLLLEGMFDVRSFTSQ